MNDTDTLSAQPPDSSGLRDKTLKIAGWSYILGDAAMFAAGSARKSPATIGGAASWLIGGIGAGVFGNPDAERQLHIQSAKLERYLAQKGVVIPDDVRARSELLKKKTLWQQFEQFCYEHPSEILNTGYAIGASLLLRSGMRELRTGNKSILPKRLAFDHGMSSDFWIGTLVLTGALIGLFAKEDPKAKEASKEKDPLSRAVAFVTEKPLRTSAALYMVNNGFLLTNALEDFSKRQTQYQAQRFKPHMFSFAQLACYLFANSMLMMSNRDQISDKGLTPEHVAELQKAAALIIASQPPAQQQSLLADISHYLAKEKGMRLDPSAIAEQIAKKAGEATSARLNETASSIKWSERLAEAEPAKTPTK